MTEEEIKELGFELTDQFTHDEFNTNRYTKCVLGVEFTYFNERLLTCELTISEVNCMIVTLEEMKALTAILGNHKAN